MLHPDHNPGYTSTRQVINGSYDSHHPPFLVDTGANQKVFSRRSITSRAPESIQSFDSYDSQDYASTSQPQLQTDSATSIVDADAEDSSYDTDNESYNEPVFVTAELGDFVSSALSNDSDWQMDLKDEFSVKCPEDIQQEGSSLSSEMSPSPEIAYISSDNYEPPPKRVQFEPYDSTSSKELSLVIY